MKDIHYKRTLLSSSRNWARIGRPDLETVTGAISSSSLSEKSSPESVSYSTGGGRASATATATRQSSTNVTGGASPPSDERIGPLLFLLHPW